MQESNNLIDYDAVREYFDEAAAGASSAASYMAHGQDLPPAAMQHRLEVELATIDDWLAAVPPSAAVLDLGCGAGAWTTILATRYAHVTGVEGSSAMAAAAREATRDLSNVEILEGDVRTAIPARDYQFAFLGGLCMYINDDDVVALLQSLKKRLGSGCSVVLRESTVPGMRDARSGRYQVVYRNVADYRNLFKRAGFASTEVRRNYGYTSMEIAIELVASRRKWVSILPKQSPALGALTWWSLRLTSPLSLWALPRLLSRAGIAWPSLQNHFFRLTT